MPTMSRHDLKKNELEDIVIFVVTWIKNNRTLFLSIAATVGVALILTIYFFALYRALNVRASDRVSMAQGLISQGKNDQAIGQLDEVINRYSRTPAAAEAALVKADLLMQMGKYDQAEKAITPVTISGTPKTVIPFAYLTLGVIQEDAAKYKEAAATYNQFLDKFPEHFAAPRVYESLGRVYELMGSSTDAKAAYEKLATLYPATPWAQNAQARMAALSGQVIAPQLPGLSAGSMPSNSTKP